MSTVRLGSESEYVEIVFPSSYLTEGWAQADVRIAVSGFSGAISPWVEKADFAAFTAQLRTVYESLHGEACFSPLEDQFSLRLCAGSTGAIHLTGHAWSMACRGNELRFAIELDQSFLAAPLAELECLHGSSAPNAATAELR
jgi:hypothetical protein